MSQPAAGAEQPKVDYRNGMFARVVPGYDEVSSWLGPSLSTLTTNHHHSFNFLYTQPLPSSLRIAITIVHQHGQVQVQRRASLWCVASPRLFHSLTHTLSQRSARQRQSVSDRNIPTAYQSVLCLYPSSLHRWR